LDDPEPNTFINCETERYSVDPEKIQAIAEYICRSLGFRTWELSITFVDSEEIRALNSEFRQIDKPTDVLSFPQQEWDEPVTFERPFRAGSVSKNAPPFMLGDLVISLEDAEKNAKDIGHALDRETCFLLVHGILHLCGHDHMEPEDEELMTAMQRQLMDKMTGATPIWLHGVTPVTAVGEVQR
jgi:probable rRNA maturation factor